MSLTSPFITPASTSHLLFSQNGTVYFELSTVNNIATYTLKSNYTQNSGTFASVNITTNAPCVIDGNGFTITYNNVASSGDQYFVSLFCGQDDSTITNTYNTSANTVTIKNLNFVVNKVAFKKGGLYDSGCSMLPTPTKTQFITFDNCSVIVNGNVGSDSSGECGALVGKIQVTIQHVL